MTDTPDQLADRLQLLYARLKMFPEEHLDREGRMTLKRDASLAFLDLRAELPAVIAELRRRGDYVAIERIKLGPVDDAADS